MIEKEQGAQEALRNLAEKYRSFLERYDADSFEEPMKSIISFIKEETGIGNEQGSRGIGIKSD